MTKNRSWLYLAILTLIVTLIWATVSAVGHFRQSTIPKDIETVATPLDPNLDIDFFTKLQQKATAQ